MSNNYSSRSRSRSRASRQDAGWVLKILSLLIWPVGLILWLVKKDSEPVAAQTCLTWAGIGICIDLFFYFFL